MKLGPWFFWVVPPTVFARAACHQKTIGGTDELSVLFAVLPSLSAELHKQRAWRLPKVMQLRSRGHHSSQPGHQTISSKPQITSSPLGCTGVPERKGVTEYYVTRFDNLREKGKHKDLFVSALPGAPSSLLLYCVPSGRRIKYYGWRSLIMPWL